MKIKGFICSNCGKIISHKEASKNRTMCHKCYIFIKKLIK